MEEHHRGALEGIVDLVSLAAVLGALVQICRDKTEHLMANWQDEPAARIWQQAAKRIDTARRAQAVQDLALTYEQNAS